MSAVAARYPEHDKLHAIKAERDVVQSFIDWLCDAERPDTAAYNICHYTPAYVETSRDDLGPLTYTVPERWFPGISDGAKARLMAEFLGIDQQRLSAEKELMLSDIRQASAVPS